MPQANRLKLPSAPAKQQIASKANWNQSRCPQTADFFTLGYSGRNAAEMMDQLKAAGVRTLVDIRQHAVSMYRPEMSKKNLAKALEEIGVAYVHRPDLGVPRQVRALAIQTGSRDVIWEWYDLHVIEQTGDIQSFVSSLDQPVALMCTELDPHECHRHRISLALERKGLNGFDL